LQGVEVSIEKQVTTTASMLTLPQKIFARLKGNPFE
jgi:hypothetical protein